MRVDGQGEVSPAQGSARAEDPHIRELRILNAIAEALNSSPDVQQALERTLGLVADLLGLRTGWIWLVDGETSHFYNAAARALPPYLQTPVRMTGRPCWCTRRCPGQRRCRPRDGRSHGRSSTGSR